jgi:hypothetical protein
MERLSLQILGPLWKVYHVAEGERERAAVLIVEDELLVRMDAADMLRDASFEVVEGITQTKPL